MTHLSCDKYILLFQGDLGAIDDKYDVAISTACGPLDNIVCDTIETAQNCVNFLKKNNIGTATFIALDKVHACMETNKSNNPVFKAGLNEYES